MTQLYIQVFIYLCACSVPSQYMSVHCMCSFDIHVNLHHQYINVHITYICVYFPYMDQCLQLDYEHHQNGGAAIQGYRWVLFKYRKRIDRYHVALLGQKNIKNFSVFQCEPSKLLDTAFQRSNMGARRCCLHRPNGLQSTIHGTEPFATTSRCVSCCLWILI